MAYEGLGRPKVHGTRAFSYLVLGGIANKALGVRERHIGWRCAVALVVGNDLNAVILPDTHAAAQQKAVSGSASESGTI